MPANKHTFLEGAWDFCGRCGDRELIDKMQWQNSVLVDPKCFDSFPIQVGDIERRQADALEQIIAQPDLQPHPKLTQPTQDDLNGSDIFI